MFLKQVFADHKPEIFTIRGTASVQDAARLMVTHQIGALLVVDEAGELAGIFSERDLARCVHRYGAEGPAKGVATFMTRDLVCCDPDDDLEAVMTLMTARHVRHLPVMESGRPVAMVSIRDVISRLLEVTAVERDDMRDYIATGTC